MFQKPIEQCSDKWFGRPPAPLFPGGRPHPSQESCKEQTGGGSGDEDEKEVEKPQLRRRDLG